MHCFKARFFNDFSIFRHSWIFFLWIRFNYLSSLTLTYINNLLMICNFYILMGFIIKCLLLKMNFIAVLFICLDTKQMNVVTSWFTGKKITGNFLKLFIKYPISLHEKKHMFRNILCYIIYATYIPNAYFFLGTL